MSLIEGMLNWIMKFNFVANYMKRLLLGTHWKQISQKLTHAHCQSSLHIIPAARIIFFSFLLFVHPRNHETWFASAIAK